MTRPSRFFARARCAPFAGAPEGALRHPRWTSLVLLGALALPVGCRSDSPSRDQTKGGAKGDDGDDNDGDSAGDGTDGTSRDGSTSSGGSNKPASKDGSTGSTSNKDGGTASGNTNKDGGPSKGGDATTANDPSDPGDMPTPPGDTKAAAAARVDNPFEGAKGYVNPEWRDKAMAEAGGERIANTPTAVWLDRTAAIEGTPNSMSNGAMGLADHLDAALEQGAGYAQFVIYNLPGRDCSALASNGELGPDDLPKYKSEYIDPIAKIMSASKYAKLRIINVIEVDSLPNLVTNTNVEQCAKMKANGGYVQGVAYALNKLGALPNVYNYVDAGHHGWLGWDTNMNPSAELFAEVAKMAGFETVHGFITNTANYSALKEPFFDVNTMVGGMSVRMAKWVDFNFYVDELSFAQAFRTKLVSLGFDQKLGMLIDTSRNGWGGSKRPTAKSSATDVNMFVDQSRIDRRIHAGNWCNQSGAGLGERPKASPESGIDAYVWIKPPGESDGASKQIQNDDGKGFDRMCDPTYGGNERNGNSATGALGDAPLSGAWFSGQFQELMQNAYPAL